MKKGFIVLLIFVLVVGAFFVGISVDLKTLTDTTTSSDENNTTEPTAFEDVYYEEPNTSGATVVTNLLQQYGGVWEYYQNGELIEVLSVNSYWEVYQISFTKNQYGNIEAIYNVSDAFDITDKSFKTDFCTYTFNGETLSCDNYYDSYNLVKKSDYSTNTFSGRWRAYNDEKFPFILVNLSMGLLSEISIYSDGTYRAFNENGFECSGEYDFVNDATAVEFEYDGNEDIYEFDLIGNGLLLLSTCGRNRESDGMITYCVLELTD